MMVNKLPVKKTPNTWRSKVRPKKMKIKFRMKMASKRTEKNSRPKMAMNTRCSSKSSRC